MDQLKESQNDYGKTIESVSNQMKVFDNQLERLQRALGNMFLPILQKILPYINAFLMVLTEIINWLATLFGYDEDMFAGFSSGVGDVTADIEDLGGSLDSADKSAKKLKQGLRGFDKLNVITTPTSGSNGAGAGSGVGNIDPRIMDAFNKSMEDYNKSLEKVQMKATKIRDNIMEWLGFTKEVDKETGKVSFKFDHITGGTVLGALAVGGTIFSGAKKVLGFLQKMGLIKLPNIGNLVKSLGNLTKLKVDGNILTKLGISPGTATTIGAVAGSIAMVVSEFWSYDGVWGQVTSKGSLSEFFKIDNAKDLIQTLFTFTGIFQGGLIPFLIIGEEKMSKLDGKTSALKDTFDSCKKAVKDFVDTTKDKIIKLYEEDIKPTVDKVKRLYEDDIKPLFEKVSKWLDDIAIDSGLLKSVLSVLAEFVGGAFRKAFELGFGGIKSIVEYVVSFISNKIKGITQIINGVVGILKGIKNGDWKQVWNGFKDIAVGAFKLMTAPIKSSINGIISMAETMANAVVSGMNTVIRALNKINIKVPKWVPEFGGKEFGINIERMKKVKFDRIDRLKTGIDFVPNDFYGPVYLDYGERVLTKEENQRYNKGNDFNSNFASNFSNNKQPINATFVIQVGNEEIARKVINDLEDMASANGKPITIG